MQTIIIVTGTPCTGKTTIAKKIASLLKFKYIDVNRLIKTNKIHDKYDKKSDSLIVDIKKLNRILETLIKKSKQNLIIDSHLSHYLPNKIINLCIVTKCDIKILKKRLKKRKYNDTMSEGIDLLFWMLSLGAYNVNEDLPSTHPDYVQEVQELKKWFEASLNRANY